MKLFSPAVRSLHVMPTMMAALVVALSSIALGANDKNAAVTDPAEADADFAVQGEYLGERGGQKYGAQVVALGEGKFDLVLYSGGLPGEGWKRGDERGKASGETKDGVTTFKSDAIEATIKDEVLNFSDGALKKVQRQSRTLGQKPPPANATILFDGQTNDFKPGTKTDDGLLMVGQTSGHIFGKDHILHLEFCTPYQPYARGQGRGNSGVYLQGKNEVQVLDSFGLEGRNNECGGFYSKREPDVNMCYPPLSWQTYDIEFRAARFDADGKMVSPAIVTVLHNGVVVHKNVELKDVPKDGGPLHLQNHGNPVRYRNIWMVETP